ncbi:MAG: cation diffusion facilitator family transporter, partial [Pseudobdellovibrionaceae bacterium]
ALKSYAFQRTQSTAILSDALETIVNIVSAIIALMIIRIVTKPADEDHPYGHGKAEYFSATFEGGLVLAAALYIIYDGALNFFKPREFQDLLVGIFYISLASTLNMVVGLYLLRVGDRNKSIAIRASGIHLMSDVKTTLGVIIGIGLVAVTGYRQLDAIIAILVGLHLLIEGYKVVRESVSGLTDEIEPSSLVQLSDCFESFRTEGIIDIHRVRAIRSGSFHHIDAHVVVPEYWDVKHAHEILHEFESKVVEKYSFEGEIAFHQDPCLQKYCRSCDVSSCPIRLNPLEKRREFTYISIQQPVQEDRYN